MRFSQNFITGWKKLLITFDFDLLIYIYVTCMFNDQFTLNPFILGKICNIKLGHNINKTYIAPISILLLSSAPYQPHRQVPGSS